MYVEGVETRSGQSFFEREWKYVMASFEEAEKEGRAKFVGNVDAWHGFEMYRLLDLSIPGFQTIREVEFKDGDRSIPFRVSITILYTDDNDGRKKLVHKQSHTGDHGSYFESTYRLKRSKDVNYLLNAKKPLPLFVDDMWDAGLIG